MKVGDLVRCLFIQAKCGIVTDARIVRSYVTGKANEYYQVLWASGAQDWEAQEVIEVLSEVSD